MILVMKNTVPHMMPLHCQGWGPKQCFSLREKSVGSFWWGPHPSIAPLYMLTIGPRTLTETLNTIVCKHWVGAAYLLHYVVNARLVLNWSGFWILGLAFNDKEHSFMPIMPYAIKDVRCWGRRRVRVPDGAWMVAVLLKLPRRLLSSCCAYSYWGVACNQASPVSPCRRGQY